MEFEANKASKIKKADSISAHEQQKPK